jgi:predicted alpha/beta superfamily hydrolase
MRAEFQIALGMLLAASPLHAQGTSVATPSPTDAIPLHSSFTMDSRTLAEHRVVNVYTPPGYAASGDSLPVLYMLDGGLAEDFPHVVNTIDSLIELRQIGPVIVVGIENTERRRDLTGPTTVAQDSTIAPHVGGSAAFRTFIRTELMPEVKRRYRTRDETSIVGESLAGLFIVETFLLEPELFHRYIALDPSLWWNGGALVAEAGARLNRTVAGHRTLFLASASEPTIVEPTARLVDLLKAQHPVWLSWEYEPRPDLEHSTIFRAVAPGAFVKVLR